jgi:hypothetical protein
MCKQTFVKSNPLGAAKAFRHEVYGNRLFYLSKHNVWLRYHDQLNNKLAKSELRARLWKWLDGRIVKPLDRQPAGITTRIVNEVLDALEGISFYHGGDEDFIVWSPDSREVQ